MRKSHIIITAVILGLLFLDASFTPSKIEANNNESSVTINQAGFFPALDYVNQQVKRDTLTWKQLSEIKFVNKPHKDYPEGVMYPQVNAKLKAKAKKPIVISGFIIPIDNDTYALSKNVFASCFFCGQAGPETIMGIKFKNLKKRLKTDQYVTLSGTFRYNETDVEDWIYHIDDAVIVKGE